MEKYLASSTYIDWTYPDVQSLAARLGQSVEGTEAIAQTCFEFVRDEIRHSTDASDQILTAKASEVLHSGTGFCYAKSHLLAALLRANGIPAAMCYQRLRGETRFTLHGLNAVHLGKAGWYRIDPRGNKPGVDAQFCPPHEQLAFELGDGEEDIPGYWAEPAPSVIRVLTQCADVDIAARQLPAVTE
ncbi:MAG: transglutaminase family protein [Pseudomonadota bacterium]